MFTGNEAASASLTQGVANVNLVLILMYSLWAIAPEDDVPDWVKWIPRDVNRAVVPLTMLDAMVALRSREPIPTTAQDFELLRS